MLSLYACEIRAELSSSPVNGKAQQIIFSSTLYSYNGGLKLDPDCRISVSSSAAQNGPAVIFICGEFLDSKSLSLVFIVFSILEYTSA